MNTVNYTPFPQLAFESHTLDDATIAVLVVRGTFEIVQGCRLRPTREQDPVAVVDTHRGVPGQSSVAMEADLAPFKPRTDVHVDAVARAPEGRPSAEWPVRVQVGGLSHDLLVRGPHVWQHFALQGWQRTRPVRCLEVPLTYELAFGGTYLVDGEPKFFRRNRVGTGWIHSRFTPRDRDLAAPQVVGLDEPEHKPGGHYEPQGTGPLPPYCEQRLIKAGTFDAHWEEKRWPLLPLDFDYGFYNSAHPGLVYPEWVRGDEHVHLVNLSSVRPVIAFQLPSYRVFGLARCFSGRLRPFPAQLDTIHIDVKARATEEHRVHLTWRGVVGLDDPIRVLETRMDHPARSDASTARAML